MKLAKFAFPLGMIGAVVYVIHTILGAILWPEYNSITTDISTLTADGSPNADMLRVLTFIYGICMILFMLFVTIKEFKSRNGMLKTGLAALLIMHTTSFIGYNLFPLSENRTAMNFQNIMHIAITGIVVVATLLSAYLIAFGYKKQEHTQSLGKFTLVLAILITVFGVLNPITLAMKLDMLGITERLEIYTIQVLMFSLSYYYTFKAVKAGGDA